MNRHIVRSFFMCLFAFLSQQMSGVNVMIFHALVLFNLSGSGNMTGSEETLVIGALQILSCFLAMCLINILGRRILLVVSVTLMGLFSILLGKRLLVVDPIPSTGADNAHNVTSNCFRTSERATVTWYARTVRMNARRIENAVSLQIRESGKLIIAARETFHV